jgi:hypothetical protein
MGEEQTCLESMKTKLNFVGVHKDKVVIHEVQDSRIPGN